MSTLQDPQSPSGRVAAGESILLSAKTLDAAHKKALGATFKQFADAHAAYAAAEAAVATAEAAVGTHHATIADAAAEVRASLDAIAAWLIAGGARRTSPLSAHSKPTASQIEAAAHATQSTLVTALTKSIRAKKGASKELLAACTRADKAVAALAKADAAILPFEKTRHTRIVTRDKLGVPWAKAFRALKNKARTVDDEKGSSVYASLFDAETAHVGTKRPKKPAKAAPTAPPTPTK